MSILHVNHIKASCKSRFAELVDVSDIQAQTAEDAETHFHSRALAAFVIAALGKVEDKEASEAITDEQFDNGIDAFLYNETDNICYVVQSKWSNAGSGSIDVASVLKFVQGVRHLLSGDTKLLGPKLRKKQVAISNVLAESEAKFVLVIAYTGRAPLSAEALMPLNSLLTLLNEDGEFVSLQVLRQPELHKIVTERSLGESAYLEILLHDYGKIDTPFRAYYGQMDVSDVAIWAKFGDKLYARNIRAFKGSTDVNEAISKTLKLAPENFIYFNNGITITCSKLQKKLLGSGSKTSGVFECNGASIVNGAQTVGSIMTFLAANQQTAVNAKVMVRITSLENCPEDFSSEITRAVNTQNRIERRDFAALDSITQNRLKTEMRLSFGKDYVFRTGEAPPLPENGCTLDDAAIALACSNKDIALAMIAKREVGRLYEDIYSPPYTTLFNPSTSSLVMWRAVQVVRMVEAHLKEFQLTSEGKMRLIAIHFNRLILHLVFRRIGAIDVSDQEWATNASPLKTITQEVLAGTFGAVVKLFPAAYPGSLFKNATKSREIAACVTAPPEPPKNGELFE